MRRTSFGKMMKLDLGEDLLSCCEVMHFESGGRSHTHLITEVAICVSGEGVVFVDGIEHFIHPGIYVVIPPNTSHWMRPDTGSTLAMLIAYQE